MPDGSIGYWAQRLVKKGVAHETLEKRFDETVLSFKDPDGMPLVLVAVPGIEGEPAWSGEAPAEHAIRGFHSVSLLLREAEPTGAILENVFGFSEPGREGSTVRYKAEGTEIGGIVDLRAAGDFSRGRQGGGSVHHIAFRAADDEAEFAMMRSSPRITASTRRTRRTAITSARSTSASLAACCSRSRPASPASRSTSRSPRSDSP